MKINIGGLFYEHSGYGKMTREYAIALYNAGLDVGQFNIGTKDYKALGLNENKLNVVESIKPNLLYSESPLLMLYMPEVYSRMAQQYYNIGYCEFETNKLPKHWIKECNKVNELFVPSNHMKQIVEDAGVKTPIYIVPQGVDVNEFKPGPGLNLGDWQKNKFKFFCNGEFIERKKIGFIIDAFCDAFTDKDDVVLIVKTYDLSDPHFKINISNKIKTIKKNRTAKIYLINTFIDDSMLPMLYNSIDCVIHASTGEGWSFIPFETLACNKKLIMNPWGPCTEYISSSLYKAIDYKMVDVPVQGIPNDKLFEGSQWAEPNKQSLIAHMKSAVNNNDSFNSREFIEQYTWDNAVKPIIERIYDIKKGPNINRPLNLFANKINMICPSWGQKCGISTYTFDLLQSLSKETSVTVNAALDSGIKHVHIQFQYGLYRYDQLQIMFERLNQNNNTIILTMHDYDNKNVQSQLCNSLIARYCDVVIVHTKLQADIMKMNGFKNIKIIPHGIDNKLINTHRHDTKYDVGYFGFSYSHKGMIELGYAIKNISSLKPKALMLSTTGVNQDSVAYSAKVKSIFDKQGIHKYVEVKSAYLETERIIELLSQCKVIVFPYEDYGNIGTSGAVRIAMLSMRPIIYTDTPFFSDIKGKLGICIENNMPSTITKELMNSHDEIGDQLEYINHCSWDNIAMLHMEVYSDV